MADSIKKYIDYVKNNPEGYWFKRKLYGWGWVPVRWQGWVVVGLFVVFLLWNAFALGDTPTNDEMIGFFIKLGLAVVVLFIICFKTGEKPRWQWGLPKNK